MGNSSVDKTSIINRICLGQFTENEAILFGIEFLIIIKDYKKNMK